MGYFRSKLSSDRLGERLLGTTFLFFVIFFGVVVAGYFLLPEGLLKNENPLQSWGTSENVPILTLQIFTYNLLSVSIIILASLFGRKNERETNYFSVGYTVFFVLIIINGIVLGTWSFSVESEAVPLLYRIAGVFDIMHKAALWEMAGQLLVTCAFADISVVRSSGKNVEQRKLRVIKLKKAEIVTFLLGILLMLAGALVESVSINAAAN